MENEEIVWMIQNGIDPKGNLEQLYLSNMGFIREIAKKYSAFVEMEDLCQEAYFSLVDAAYRYDPGKESSFLTLLSYILRSQFRRFINNTGSTKRIPAHMQERIQKYRSYLSECESNGKQPSDQEVCWELNISDNQLENIRKVMYEADLISLNDMIPGTDVSIGEGVADPVDVETDVIERVSAEQIRDELWEIISELDSEQSDILIDRYRLSHTLKEVGEKRGMPLERIRQIEDKALKILSGKRKIRELAEDYGIYANESRAYRGSVGSFRNHRSSITEYIAIKSAEADERMEGIRKKSSEMVNEIMELLLKKE